MDYTNLNGACPKDTFPLPRIDQIVDVIVDHEHLSFFDAYLGYNQIIMCRFDESKIATCIVIG